MNQADSMLKQVGSQYLVPDSGPRLGTYSAGNACMARATCREVRVSGATPQRCGNLPAELTSFVGRGAQLGEVRRLTEISRLVTVTGPGGVGKTRLALRATYDLGKRFPDGIWVADLSAVTRPVTLAYTIAGALQMNRRGVRHVADALAEQIAEKHMLLVLDTCEHLIDACAPFAEKLLQAAPRLQIIATSRQRLGTSSEHVLAIGPLQVPAAGAEADPQALQHVEAVALFTDRARALVPAFTVSRRNGASIAALCRRLDGMPLAIEHATARLRSLTADQLLELIDDRARLLDYSRRGGVARQRTLRATIAWSERLCTLSEKLAWARLSVFAGEFGLEAAVRMCAGVGIRAGQELAMIESLVDKSIVLAVRRRGKVRYRLLEDYRARGREYMRLLHEAENMGQRHRDWCLELAKRGEQEWMGGRQLEVFQRLQDAHADLLAALEFCATTPGERWAGLELAACLWFYWIGCGRPGDGRYWLDRAIGKFAANDIRAGGDNADDVTAGHADADAGQADGLTQGKAVQPDAAKTSYAKALWARGFISILQGDTAAASRYLEESRDQAAAAGDEATLTLSLHRLGTVALICDDHARATSLLSDAVARYEKLGEPNSNMIMARTALALAAVLQGDLGAAVDECMQTQAICEESGDLWAHVYVSCVQAVASWAQGEPGEAARHAREGLRGARLIHDVVGIVVAIELIALVAADRGGPGRAAVLLGAAEGIWRDLGLPMFGSGFLGDLHDLSVRRTREALSAKELATASGYGAALSLDEAVARALAEDEDAETSLPAGKAAAAPWPPLSNRECQVAALVADGLCNREIAQRLIIAKRTADSHVEHILAKLMFTSRTQVAAWVTQKRAVAEGEAQHGVGAA
jgi:predicted ATPase/DNA-binding CsgD family transcriptional regulator